MQAHSPLHRVSPTEGCFFLRYSPFSAAFCEGLSSLASGLTFGVDSLAYEGVN
jgi:hypothetical protein